MYGVDVVPKHCAGCSQVFGRRRSRSTRKGSTHWQSLLLLYGITLEPSKSFVFNQQPSVPTEDCGCFMVPTCQSKPTQDTQISPRSTKTSPRVCDPSTSRR